MRKCVFRTPKRSNLGGKKQEETVDNFFLDTPCCNAGDIFPHALEEKKTINTRPQASKHPSTQAPKHPSTMAFYSRVFYSRKNNAFTPSQTIAPTHATLISSLQLLPTAPFLAFHAHLKNDLALSNQSHDLDGVGKV